MPRRVQPIIQEIGELAREIYETRIRPQMLEDPDAESLPTTRRRLVVPRRSLRADARNMSDPDPAKRQYGDPVFTWAFQSSQPRGGTIVTYETRLEVDGVLRCNCMGWIFQRKDKDTGRPKPRECKHTKIVEEEAPGILRRFNRGETLEVLNPEARAAVERGTRSGRQSSRDAEVANPPRSDSTIRHGRVITL